MKEIKFFGLSTCPHCKRMRKLLDDEGVKYMLINVDLLKGPEQTRALKELRDCNPEETFPTLVCEDEVVVGFNEREVRKALGL